MKAKITIALALLLLGGVIHAQVRTTIPLPKDIIYGKLENGLTYYIYSNQEPQDRVSFYFAQNVGAILEKDNEDGLAHFLEHMAFNGSTNFKGRAMDNFLEQKGLSMGEDFNAYTAHDETLYNINNVIATDENAVNNCLLILHDWSGSLSLEGKSIDDERGVIREEWRQGRNPQTRIQEKIQPILFKGSKYAKRDVIGKLDFINSFPHKSLRSYYKKWYRPDLQAVIVVGDIDAPKMEQKIKTLFSKIPLSKNAEKRPYYKVPDQKEISYLLAKDKGVPTINVSWGFKEDIPTIKDEAYIRNELATYIFTDVLNTRYMEKSEDPKSSVSYFAFYEEPISLDKKLNNLSFEPKAGKTRQGFEDLYTELVRLQNYGVSDSELQRAKETVLNEYKTLVSQEKNKKNEEWAEELAYHFLQATPILKAKDKLTLIQKQLTTITKEEINTIAQKFRNKANSILMIIGPEDPTIKYPTKEELMAIVDKVDTSTIANYTDDTNKNPLITETLQITTKAKRFTIKGIPKAKGYELENGVKVILYPSKEKEDEIAMQAISFGGTSKINTNDIPSASKIGELISLSGVGDFSATQLSKKLAGHTVEVSPYVDSYSEGLTGSSTLKDFEMMLQLTYLYFKNPRFDQALFEAQLPTWKETLVRSQKDEQTIFYNKLAIAMTNANPRRLPETLRSLSKVSFKKAVTIYKERFANAADFTFVFTGNFEEKKALQLLQKYLGNLNASAKKERWVDHKILPKKGTTKVEFAHKMVTPQTSIFYHVSGTASYTIENEIMLDIIKNTLDKRYIDTIREEEGGSYGVAVYTDFRKVPKERFSLNINFNCNPEKRAHLLAIVKNEIEAIKANGPSIENVEKAKQNLIKSRLEAIQKDDFWTSEIIGSKMYGMQYVSIDTYQQLVQTITPEKIKAFAKKIIAKGDIVEVVMNPKQG